MTNKCWLAEMRDLKDRKPSTERIAALVAIGKSRKYSYISMARMSGYTKQEIKRAHDSVYKPAPTPRPSVARPKATPKHREWLRKHFTLAAQRKAFAARIRFIEYIQEHGITTRMAADAVGTNYRRLDGWVKRLPMLRTELANPVKRRAGRPKKKKAPKKAAPQPVTAPAAKAIPAKYKRKAPRPLPADSGCGGLELQLWFLTLDGVGHCDEQAARAWARDNKLIGVVRRARLLKPPAVVGGDIGDGHETSVEGP